MHQPHTKTRPKKVKIWEPDTFNSTDLHKLQDFLVSCNLHFRDHPYVYTSDEKKILFGKPLELVKAWWI